MPDIQYGFLQKYKLIVDSAETKMEKLFPDKYSLNARWYPSALLSLPFVVIIHTISITNLDWMQKQVLTEIAGMVASFAFCSGAMIVFCADHIRNLGRKLQQKYFAQGKRLPTTEFLLWKNREFSDERKVLIRDAIKSDFHLELLSREEEQKDEDKARQLIKEAVDEIRPRVNDGVRLLEYNIRFGFARNLSAGARAIGLPASLICGLLSLVWLHNQACLIVEAILAIFYWWRVKNTEEMLDFSGEEYARVLFAEYLDLRERNLQG